MKSALSKPVQPLDAMILVAAIAVGMSLTQWMGTSIRRGGGQWTGWWNTGGVSTWSISLAVPWLIAGTLSNLAIRLRLPTTASPPTLPAAGVRRPGRDEAILVLDVVIALPVTLVPGPTVP